jgi:hypothetical protein
MVDDNVVVGGGGGGKERVFPIKSPIITFARNFHRQIRTPKQQQHVRRRQLDDIISLCQKS